MCTGSLDKTVRLWDLQAGMPLSISKSHGGTVRCLAMDTGALVSGSSDHALRVWLAQAEASHSHHLSPPPSASVDTSSGSVYDLNVPLFNLSAADHTLLEHKGPLSSCCLTDAALFSGSWDCTVRAWSRETYECTQVRVPLCAAVSPCVCAAVCMRVRVCGCICVCLCLLSAVCMCVHTCLRAYLTFYLRMYTCMYACLTSFMAWLAPPQVLQYDDWVWSVAARGSNLLVSSGPDVLVHDLSTGQLVRKFTGLHEGHVAALEGSASGRLLFTGTSALHTAAPVLHPSRTCLHPEP